MDFATADTTVRNLIALGSLQADLGHVRNMLPALSRYIKSNKMVIKLTCLKCVIVLALKMAAAS